MTDVPKCELCGKPSFWTEKDAPTGHLCAAHRNGFLDNYSAHWSARSFIDSQKRAQQVEPWPGVKRVSASGICSACGVRTKESSTASALCQACDDAWHEARGLASYAGIYDWCRQRWAETHSKGGDANEHAGNPGPVEVASGGTVHPEAAPVHCAACNAICNPWSGRTHNRPLCCYCTNRLEPCVGASEAELVANTKLHAPRELETRAAWDWDADDAEYEL